MKNIKIGACDWALPGGGQYAVRIASDAGLDALSLRLGTSENNYPLTHPEMQKIYLEEQQKYGIDFCAVSLNDFTSVSMHARENTKEYQTAWNLVRKAVPAAKVLGAQTVQVPCFSESEMTTEEDMTYSAEVFRYLCDAGAEWDICIAAENDLDPEGFRTLYEMVDRENFFLYFDSQNYYARKGYDQVEILENLYPYMCNQLHVKDGEVLSGGLLGSGPSDFFRTMDWLDKHYYSGYILLENDYDAAPLCSLTESPYELLKTDIRTLRRAIASDVLTA